MENLLDGCFHYNYFTPNFLSGFFSELVFLVGDKKKFNKIYQRKLKPGDRLWVLNITHWKLSLYRKLFWRQQTSQFSQF